MCTFGLSGFTRQPENSKRFQTPPKNHETTHSEREKRAKLVAGDGKKKREILGPPPFSAPPFGAPPFGAPDPKKRWAKNWSNQDGHNGIGQSRSLPHEMQAREVEPSSLQPHTRRAPATTSKGSQLVLVFFRMHARPPQRIKKSALFQPSYHRAVHSKASGARHSSFSGSDGHYRASTRGSRCRWRQSRLVDRICFLSNHVTTRNLHLEVHGHDEPSARSIHAKVAPDRLTWSSKSVAADPRAPVARSKSHVLQDAKPSTSLPGDSRQHDSDTRRLVKLCRARWLLAAHARMDCSRCVAASNADRAVPRIVSTCKNYLVIFRSSRVLDGVN